MIFTKIVFKDNSTVTEEVGFYESTDELYVFRSPQTNPKTTLFVLKDNVLYFKTISTEELQ